MEEKVVQEPNMLRQSGIQAMIDFEVDEEHPETTYFIEKGHLPQI
jgi:hypothetical protein